MGNNPEPVGHILLEHLFCKHSKFEQLQMPTGSPQPQILSGSFPLKISIRCFTRSEELVDVELSVEIAPEEGPSTLPYRVETTFVGRFRIRHLPGNLTLDLFARRNGAAILFPYVREAVSSMTMKGSFGPIQLPPVNIVAMLEHGEQANAENGVEVQKD